MLPATTESGGRYLPTWRALNFSSSEATCANLDLDDLAVFHDACNLKIWSPRATSLVVGMRNVVSKRYAFIARVTAMTIDGHVLIPD